MKNTKYYGSLRSRDNQKKVDLSQSSKRVIITTYTLLQSLSSFLIFA